MNSSADNPHQSHGGFRDWPIILDNPVQLTASFMHVYTRIHMQGNGCSQSNHCHVSERG